MFYTGARNSGRILEPVPMTPEEIQQGNAGQAMIKMYFDQLFDLRRKNPGDDLTTQLLQAEEEGSKLSNDELYANIILLFGAGHETTVNLIGNGLLALFRNPGPARAAQGQARTDHQRDRGIPALRLLGADDRPRRRWKMSSSAAGSSRRARACCACSARPTTIPRSIPITRSGSISPGPNVRPLSFGGGIHFCLGAQLARIEAEVAINTLLRRIPDLRLDDAVNAEWRPSFVLRGLLRLPASW